MSTVLDRPLAVAAPSSLPGADEMHRVPSGYWKVISTPDGRVSSFIFDQRTPRSARYCDMRVPLEQVELRARLRLFPRLAARAFQPLDAELGCA